MCSREITLLQKEFNLAHEKIRGELLNVNCLLKHFCTMKTVFGFTQVYLI